MATLSGWVLLVMAIPFSAGFLYYVCAGRFVLATVFLIGLLLVMQIALNLIWPSLFWPSA